MKSSSDLSGRKKVLTYIINYKQMKIVENWFRASDGEMIFYHEYLPDRGEVKYIIQIAHGMAEHSARYERFAYFFTARGAAVYINDHRGHGRTARTVDNTGVWSYKNAWDAVVDDIRQLNDIAGKEHPDKDIVLLGHSMGSFLAISYLTKYCKSVEAVILTGTGHNSSIKIIPACTVARAQCLFLGTSNRSKFLHKKTFGSFDKRFDKKFAWLTRREKTVEEYIEDPYCGAVFTSSFYKNLFTGLMYNNKQGNLGKTRKDLPMMIMSGTDDPVGDFGRGPAKVAERYKEIGMKDVQVKMYQDARHEILNEINYKEVYQDIFEWINTKINTNNA